MKHFILFLTSLISFNSFSCNDTLWKNVDLRGITSSTNKGIHQIRFVKVDTISSKQRWTYQIKTNSKYSISHSVFGLNPCVSVYSISMGSQTILNPVNQLQPPTYVSGIKADWSIPANITVTIQIITNDFYLSDSGSVYLKSGQAENYTSICLPKCVYYLDLKDAEVFHTIDKVYFKFVKNPDDVVFIYEFNEKTGMSKLITSTTESNIILNHTSKYYLVVSGRYSRYFGPFSLVSEDPRRTLSVKQLLGQIVD